MTVTVDYSVEPSTAEAKVGDQRISWRSPEGGFNAVTGNFALMACLPIAMRQGAHLHVSGRVDKQAVRNAWLLSHYWVQWRPDLYKPVTISADEIVDTQATADDGYAVCLSGGVDSTYACLSASAGSSAENRFKVGMGIFIQGFDFGLGDHDGYSKVLQSIRQSVADIGIRVTPVETNWRDEICGQSGWEDLHTLGLATVLHLFDGSFRGGLIGSDYTFREDHAVAPWSSNSTANRLLSARNFEIQPVGENATHIEKIKAIHDWGKLALMNVCWAGPRTGVNCSNCEKCLRTMLMCEALGIDPRPTFGRAPMLSEIRGLPLTSATKIAFIQQAIDLPNNVLPNQLRRAAQFAIWKSRAKTWLGR